MMGPIRNSRFTIRPKRTSEYHTYRSKSFLLPGRGDERSRGEMGDRSDRGGEIGRMDDWSRGLRGGRVLNPVETRREISLIRERSWERGGERSERCREYVVRYGVGVSRVVLGVQVTSGEVGVNPAED